MTDAAPEQSAVAAPKKSEPPSVSLSAQREAPNNNREAPNNANKPRPRRLPRLGYTLLIILAIGLGAAGTASYWWPLVEPYVSSPGASDNQQASQQPAQPPAPAQTTPAPAPAPQANQQAAALDARLGAIEQRLDRLQSLNDRIAALENRPAPDASAAMAPLADRLQQMDQRLDGIEARLQQMAKDQTARGDSAQRVLIVALAELGNTIASSQPFAAQLASVEALGQSRPGWATRLQPLEEAAKTGLPSTAILTQRFSDTVAPAILRAAQSTPSPDASWWDAIVGKLRALVIIRRTDSASSDNPTEAAVATAEMALAKSDLAGAVAALGNLDGAAKSAAAAWLATAQQRLDAQQIVAKLTRDVASDLAAGASTSGG